MTHQQHPSMVLVFFFLYSEICTLSGFPFEMRILIIRIIRNWHWALVIYSSSIVAQHRSPNWLAAAGSASFLFLSSYFPGSSFCCCCCCCCLFYCEISMQQQQQQHDERSQHLAPFSPLALLFCSIVPPSNETKTMTNSLLFFSLFIL